MEDIFNSVYGSGGQPELLIVCLLVALALGVGLAFCGMFRSRSSTSFLVTVSLLPVSVTTVIFLVNGNIGAGVAVAGAFSLVRFRSMPASAKEIAVIFIAMAVGLALGMGYIGIACIFALISGAFIIILSFTNMFDQKFKRVERSIRITIPEDLDYTGIFDEVFALYTKKYELIRVKTINLGSMFRLSYVVTLNSPECEKLLIDDLRARNGNLEIISERVLPEETQF